MNNNVICETQRLLLRKIEKQDADKLLHILGDPEVMMFSVHGPDSIDGVHKFIKVTHQRYERDGMAQWAVILKDSNELIGECGISVQNIDGLKEFEIGYRFNKNFWRKGYGSEAALACHDLGLNQLRLKRMISIIEKENEASIAVAKKIGMTLEKESVFHNIPVQIYSITSKVNSF